MCSVKKRKLENSLDYSQSFESTSKGHKLALETKTESEDDYFPLVDLPNELILLIFGFLTADELVSVSSIGNKRLADLTHGIRWLDFSSSGSNEPGKFYTYVSKRSKVIKQLSFSFAKHLTSSIIIKIASRCKNLTELSIMKCNINDSQLRKIFEYCSSISKLSWDLKKDYATKSSCNPIPSVKFLNLLLDENFDIFLLQIVESINKLLNTVFSGVEVAWIYFMFEKVADLPIIGPWTRVSCFSGSEAAESWKKRIFVLPDIGEKFLKILKNRISLLCDKSSQGLSGNDTFFLSSFVQLKSDVASISLLSSCPSTMFSSITVLLTPEIIFVSEKLAEFVNHVAGVKLKYFVLQDFQGDCSTVSSNDHISLAVCDGLQTIFTVSSYITVLNIFSVHFVKSSPFKSLKTLKFLKCLFIPSCAFPESHPELETVSDQRAVKFEDVVKACPCLEDFILIFCCSCSGGLVNESLLPLQEWKELKKLELYSISLKSCEFLRKISVSCQKLESLSLISFAFNAASYVPDVIYFLKNTKRIKFLQINDTKFNPMYERFWELIGDCYNLQGICIYTQFCGYVHKQRILKAIKKLKRLQLFHFNAGESFSDRNSDFLENGVRKCMFRNGVKNCFIDESITSRSFEPKSHHEVPLERCAHLHVI